MTKPTVIYNRYDVVKVPFPFTDQQASKSRPALIISSATSFNDCIGHSVIAMITSAQHAPWPLDTFIADLNSARFTSGIDHPVKAFYLGSPPDHLHIRPFVRLR